MSRSPHSAPRRQQPEILPEFWRVERPLREVVCGALLAEWTAHVVRLDRH